jgi:hypothetical protein
MKKILLLLILAPLQSCYSTQNQTSTSSEKVEAVEMNQDNRKEKSPNPKPVLNDNPMESNDPMRKGKDALRNNPDPKK